MIVNLMLIIIRTDASIQIGSGHVMRCLTLAGALRDRGADVRFICRELPGHLGRVITEKGFPVIWLPEPIEGGSEIPALTAHSAWLGVPWEIDAEQTGKHIAGFSSKIDWLIVDSYALDREWESRMRHRVNRIMVIDDLADRSHDCDILVDQNYANPLHLRYRTLLPTHCNILAGSEYALVRPEFAKMRAMALSSRKRKLRRVLITMGGSDPTNETCKALQGIEHADEKGLALDVVIGISNPHRYEVETACNRLSGSILHVQTSRMADLMAAADCAICSGGSITWERCTLGLPAIVTILSIDQLAITEAVDKIGGHRLLGWYDQLNEMDYAHALTSLDSDALWRMSEIAAGICDGNGTERVVTYLLA